MNITNNHTRAKCLTDGDPNVTWKPGQLARVIENAFADGTYIAVQVGDYAYDVVPELRLANDENGTCVLVV